MEFKALAGSTNAILHLTAAAGRAEIPLSMDDFDKASDKIPVLVNCEPSGEYVMEDFHNAGGLSGLLNDRIKDKLHLDCMTVNGKTLGENIADGEVYNDDVIRGNLAPDGAILKTAVASPEPRFTRGYYKLNEEQVGQPDKGYDWKILKGKGGAPKNPRIG